MYRASRTLEWHVDHHLNDPRHPRLGFLTAEHAEYAKFIAAVDEEIERTLEAAKVFSLEDLMNAAEFPVSDKA
jgi:hypothetical protein